MAQRNITDAAVVASKTQHGIAHAQCVEATFGAKVTSSQIVVGFVGDWNSLRVETSIDYGRTWQALEFPDQTIPGLVKDTIVIHTEVLTRVLFLDHADTTLIRSITTVVVLGTGPDETPGDTVTRTESGATLGSGALIGCWYDSMRNGLAAIPQVSVEFSKTAGVAVGTAWGSPHDANEQPQGLHISHGRPISVNKEQGAGNEVVVEVQDIADDDHLIKAACTIEIWVYPTAFNFSFGDDHHTILSWMADTKGNGTGEAGCALQLIPAEDPPTSTTRIVPVAAQYANVKFVRYGYTFKTPDIYAISGSLVQTNQWSRIAVVYDGFRVRLIVNDAVANSVAFRTDPKEVLNVPNDGSDHPEQKYGCVVHTTGKFILGNEPIPNGNSRRQFFGKMSELRIYNREATLATGYLKGRRRLSNNDIAALKVTDGLAEYWPLNDGKGNSAVGKVLGTALVFPTMGQANGVNWNTSYDTFLGRPYELTVRQGTRADTPATGEPQAPSYQTEVIDTRYAPARTSTPMVVEAHTNVIKITNAPFDVVFPDGRVFLGVGQFAGLDTIQEPTEIGPTGINVSLTALDESLVGLAMKAIYLDGSLKAYEVYFDVNDQLVQDPVLIFGGLMDSININGGKEPTVVVSAESQLRNWQRSSIIKWNDEGHRSHFPQDHGFEFVGRTVDQIVWWPRKTTTSGF